MRASSPLKRKMMNNSSKWCRYTCIIILIIILLVSIMYFINMRRDASYNDKISYDIINTGLLRSSAKQDISSSSSYDGSGSISAISSSSGDGNTCKSFTPTCSIYPYVRYWNNNFDKKQDCYVSPFRVAGVGVQEAPAALKYIVPQPDKGGWNQYRMSMETAFVLAMVTGRVLVLPKAFRRKKRKEKMLNPFDKSGEIWTTDKLFDLNKVSDLVDMITMDEFLVHVVEGGAIKGANDGSVSNLDQAKIQESTHYGTLLWAFLEAQCYVRPWDTDNYFMGFNITGADGRSAYLHRANLSSSAAYHPVVASNLVNDDEQQRYRSYQAYGVMSYDAELHSKAALFLPGDEGRPLYRLFTHFYTYLYFADIHMDRYYKRVARDRLRYQDVIFCVAGQVVKLLHEMSAKIMPQYKAPVVADDGSSSNIKAIGGDTSKDATYFAYHFRRVDFLDVYHYIFQNISTHDYWHDTQDLLDSSRSRVIYIATDDPDLNAFATLRHHASVLSSSAYHIVFLDDLLEKMSIPEEMGAMSRLQRGMVEQVVCANAHTFIGTPLSTYTGYITRLRGYYRDQRYQRTYYGLKEYRDQLKVTDFAMTKEPLWSREFAAAHDNIDDFGYKG